MTGLWADVDDLDDPTSEHAESALTAASYILWVLSGRKWGGVYKYTEQYTCAEDCPPGCGDWTPTLQEVALGEQHIGMIVGNPYWGEDPGERLLFLRHRPVRKLDSVFRMGTGQPVEGLAVYDYAYLAPGLPRACDPGFEPCGLVVTYDAGSIPPEAGRLAALRLANELILSQVNPDECSLPERVTSVSRQGISYQVFDPQDFLEDGRTGIYSVDLFLKTVNPNGAQARARVFSPDMPRARRRTFP